MARIITHSKRETQEWGRQLGQSLQPGTLVTLQGDLGAGKTTLTQGLLEGLGAIPPYPSPTFVLMNQYELPKVTVTGIARVYHADAYRVGRDDFEKLGFLEWCADPNGLVILEWPERLGDLVPKKKTAITLRSLSETEREISLEIQSA
ncbi:MAG: tRNA (adenosine(37)-N6)-threonylcarbamoyltransferase complex ATPase subunit type 1 TsaE [Undibacterium sp.]